MGALYLKYRPRDLKEIVGNEGVVASLRSLLARESEDLPRAYLFSGPSGCGKTTLARIVASAVGCSEEDVTEVDSADFRGIDTIREIRRKMHLRPIGGGKFRAWILDECHQLSKDAQSALLKALEDTPEHVFFFLCTTDPQKLLPTIKNRCTQLTVESLSETQLYRLLLKVVKREKKQVPKEVLETIAEEALGSARAALVILDRVIDLETPEEMMKAARSAAVEENEVIDLCRALARGAPWRKVSGLLSGLKGKAEPESIRRALLGYFSSVLLRTGDARAYVVLACLRQPIYDTGFPGLVAALYEIVHAE